MSRYSQPDKYHRVKPSTPNDIRPTEHLGLVRKWAVKYAARHPIEDSEQYADGLVGLLRAAELFDPSYGCKFSTYASYHIRQAITKRYDYERKRAERTGIKPASVSQISQIGDEDDTDIEFTGKENTFDTVCERDLDAHRKRLVARLLKFVSPQEANIVRQIVMRERTLCDVGAEIGVTKERVRQIVKIAMEKLSRRAIRAVRLKAVM
jgi:RNA polymerase sigma-32 factor